jgi:hypothetical protein
MIGLAFFYLLRPGEYAHSPQAETCPFRLCDVQLFLPNGMATLNLATATDDELLAASSASLTFTDQKNGVKGEVIHHAHSGDPYLSPVKILARRVIHLRSHNAPWTTPLCHYYRNHQTRTHLIKPNDITTALRAAVTRLGPATLGFLPTEVSARSLRASGANALLCAKVDTDMIRLLGRWRSDEMFRYLHLQAQPIMQAFARKMLVGGDFTLIPNQFVPSY